MAQHEEKDISEYCYKLIKKRSWHYSLTTGVPQDQIESEGMLEYVKCLAKFDSENSTKFTTFLYSCIENRFKDFCKEWYKQIPAVIWNPIVSDDGEELPFPEIAHNDMTEHLYSYREIIAKLSPPAQGIALILEECADEIITNIDTYTVKNPHSSKHLKGALKRFLLKLGWKQNTINKAFTELSMAVQTM